MNHGLMYLAATFYAFAFFHIFFSSFHAENINNQFPIQIRLGTREKEKDIFETIKKREKMNLK